MSLSRRLNPPARGLAGLIVTFVAAALLQQYAPAIGAAGVLAGLAALTALLFFVLPSRPEAVPSTGPWLWLGTAAAAALGLSFRLAYLQTVPIGYNFEPLNFVLFADELIERGFPYEPYSWYAHTFYSYVIALFRLGMGSATGAFRAASAAISIATLVALYACLRAFFGARTAWIGVALLGPSHWHLFMSRNGYHQFLLPLFQLLFVLGLVEGCRRRSFRWLALAAVSLVLGLHSHWGFYLMPVYGVVFLVSLAAVDRAQLRASWKPVAAATALTALLLVPLAYFFWHHQLFFDYILRGFSPAASETVTLGAKVTKNLQYVFRALAGGPPGPGHSGDHTPATHAILSVLLLAGLAVSLRRCRNSPAHASLVLLLGVNVAGIGVMVGNYFYVSATLAAVFGLAAVGLATLGEECERVFPRWGRTLALAGTLAVVGAHAWGSAREILGRRIYTDLSEPHGPPGIIYAVLADARERVATASVYIPEYEPGRDFDEQMFWLRKLPEYRFFERTHAFHVGRLLFPAADVGDAREVVVYLPPGPFVSNEVLPAYQRLYPHLEHEAPPPPAPYRSEPFVARIRIPRADVAAYHGLTPGAPAGGTTTLAGFLQAPGDGRYIVRASRSPAPRLLVHGVAVSIPDGGEGDLWLESGLHPVRVLARGGADVSSLEWLRPGTADWVSLAPYLLNPASVEPDFFTPYLASPGRAAAFAYVFESAGGGMPADCVPIQAARERVEVDLQAAQLRVYDSATGRLLRHRYLAHLWPETEAVIDRVGQVHVKTWPAGFRTYTADGHLLFHPITTQPSLFVSPPAQVMPTNLHSGLVFSEGGACTVSGGRTHVYARRTVSQP